MLFVQYLNLFLDYLQAKRASGGSLVTTPVEGYPTITRRRPARLCGRGQVDL